MKKTMKRLFAVLLAGMMLFTLCASSFADWGYGSDDYSYGYDNDPGVFVYFPDYELQVQVGKELKVRASVMYADDYAKYEWRSSVEGIVKIRSEKDTAYITGLKPGHTEITLTVTSSDGINSDFDFFELDVKESSPAVTVKGGENIRMNVGESKKVSAAVSGGSGQYLYEWDTNNTSAISIVESFRNNAEVYAGGAGSGTLFLTVYDELDYSNNATIQWNFTVENKGQDKAPTVELSRGTIDMGAGSTASLMMAVTGGSGSYDYYWWSDNSSIVSVVANGTSADLRATSTVLPYANTAQINAYVKDKKTGLLSSTVSCTVHVTGESTSFDYFANATVGSDLRMNAAAEEMNTLSRVDFGRGISNSANIMFESTGSSVGTLRLRDGNIIRAGTNYSFETFRTMFFRGDKSGSFNTNYKIVDGGCTITGKISIGVTGGISVTNVNISSNILQMPTNSNQYLRINVTPLDASYAVTWTTSDVRIVSVAGGGNQVTLLTNNLTGGATITATVTDAYGRTFASSCYVTVYPAVDPTVYYDTTLTVMLGSDYYGSKLADTLTAKFKAAFGYYPSENDTIRLTKLGNSRYGTMYQRNGSAAQMNRNYTFRDWIDMYFVPAAAGTYEMSYEISHAGNVMSGNIKITVQAASMTVNMNPSALQMSPYSTQYISVSVEPSSRSYRINWSSSDVRVATVSGNNTTALVSSVANGTAVITATVTDNQGVEIRRSCTVMVTSTGSTFNPSVSTTLGIPYVGTGTSSAMRSQFQSVYGVTLQDNATIRFASTGNNEVAVMRLADGSMIRPNTDYTLAQYVAMYTQPVAAGTYSVPYTLTYAGKSLTGTVSVIVTPASISTNLNLASNEPYCFSDPLNGTTGNAIFTDSIRNASGSAWAYLRFDNVASDIGKLYLDRNGTEIAQSSVLPQSLATLYFVPGTQNGTFNAPYTVYTSNGAVVATGVLSISRPGVTFNDVPSTAYYAPAVTWAVNKGITSGTGGGNFSPNMTVTRGQAVTFLWRAAGQPKVTGAVNPFADVAVGAYYYDAVLWAVQQGITQGTSATTFSPDNPLNRDMILTFLCRSNGGYAGGPDWSKLAVDWATSCGLLAGVPGTFTASSACPRCDVVYYLWKNYSGN